MAEQITKVSLSNELYRMDKAESGSEIRSIISDSLEKVNSGGGNVTSLYDGEHYINAANLLTPSGVKKALKNQGDNGKFSYIPIGKSQEKDKVTVSLFFDKMPSKESEKQFPMTSRAICDNLSYMNLLLDKIIWDKDRKE